MIVVFMAAASFTVSIYSRASRMPTLRGISDCYWWAGKQGIQKKPPCVGSCERHESSPTILTVCPAEFVFQREFPGSFVLSSFMRIHSAAASAVRVVGAALSPDRREPGTAAIDSADGRKDVFIQPFTFLP